MVIYVKASGIGRTRAGAALPMLQIKKWCKYSSKLCHSIVGLKAPQLSQFTLIPHKRPLVSIVQIADVDNFRL